MHRRRLHRSAPTIGSEARSISRSTPYFIGGMGPPAFLFRYDPPFLLYLAFGACHFPHHVPREFIEKYRGRYDIGWDAVRATRLERQRALGIVPAGTGLAPLNPGVTPWRDLAPDVRRLCARLQETYAAFLEHTDVQIGRLMEYLDSLGNLEGTLIVLLSENGASP